MQLQSTTTSAISLIDPEKFPERKIQLSNRKKPVIERLTDAANNGPIKTRMKARKKLEKMYEQGRRSDSEIKAALDG